MCTPGFDGQGATYKYTSEGLSRLAA
jgi:hypothetical protein